MQALAHVSAKLFENFLSSLFDFKDGDVDVCCAELSSDDEPDENHPLSHSYFGA